MHSKTPTILSAAALAVAVLGITPLGHAAAGLVLPVNSVGTTQLKKQSVTGLKVRDHSLTAVDFKAGQLPAGPQGLKGDTGPAGAQGAAGPAGVTGYQRVDATPIAIGAGASVSLTATCPTGKKVFGGGAGSSSQMLQFRFLGPAGTDTYFVTAKNVGNAADKLYVWAICATVS